VDVLTRHEIERARRTLGGIIDEVCGVCELNCCHQGTMVGSQDARRIAKSARLSPEFRDRLLAGLVERARELRRDLEGLERVTRLLRARFADQQPAEVARLDDTLAEWRRFCDFLEHDCHAEPAELQHCLIFSAIRAKALRALRAFPGGEGVVPTLAGSGTSFRAGRRGVKADRCLFHHGGCLVPTAKPHKCADFYCGSDPGLIHEVVDRMVFDDFTLAHFDPRTRSGVLDDLATELSLGPEYFEPKVIIGGDDRLAGDIGDRLARVFPGVESRAVGGGHFDATLDLPDWSQRGPDEALVLACRSIDAVGIYEMAVSLVRARGRSVRPAVVVLAEELRRCAGAVHELWRIRAMSQPISALNLWALTQ
jgi:hypothetical protein